MRPVATPEERRRVLEARYPTWEPMTFAQRCQRVAGEFPDRPWVITERRTFTYQDVADLSRELGDGLAALGVRPGDRVGLVMANFAEYVPLKVAISRVGAIAVGINFFYREDELAYVLAQSDCRVLITMSEFSGLNYLQMLDDVAPGWERGTTEQLPHLTRVVQFGAGGPERSGVLNLDELANLGRRHEGATDALEIDPMSGGDMLFTSGSTGRPKGALLTHDALQRAAYASVLTRAFEDGRRLVFSLPCYHQFGLGEGIVASMLVGGAVIMLTEFSPEGYFQAIQTHRANDILVVPTMAVQMVESPRRHDFDLSTAYAMLTGGAQSPTWFWERATDELGLSELTTAYGMTELAGCWVMTLPEDPLERLSTSVGRIRLAGAASIPGNSDGAMVELRVIDPVSGQDLPITELGELCVRGPMMMLGYWNKPVETAEALRDGWMHTGDLGRMDEDGYLYLTGRSKELYKSGGELVMPKEVEEVVSRHPTVSQAYAVGVPDDRWGESGCVWIVPAPGAVVDPAEIIAHCKASLARFKVPRYVLVADFDSLPRTATGKLQKFKLAEMAAKQIGASGTAFYSQSLQQS